MVWVCTSEWCERARHNVWMCASQWCECVRQNGVVWASQWCECVRHYKTLLASFVSGLTCISFKFLSDTPHPSQYKYEWGERYIGITLSVCPSVVLPVCPIGSAQYLLNRSPVVCCCCCCLLLFTKLGIVVYHYEAMCHAETLVHYLQCQGHNEVLYNQNMTIFTLSSKLLVRFQLDLVW